MEHICRLRCRASRLVWAALGVVIHAACLGFATSLRNGIREALVQRYTKASGAPNEQTERLPPITRHTRVMALSATLKRAFFLAVVALSALVVVNATQAMQRPDAFKDAPRKFATSEVKPQVIHKRAGSKVQAAYFTNW